MTRLIIALVVGSSAIVFAPAPVEAQGCTREYHRCLNDTHDLSGWSQTMADIECFAGYAGCLKTEIIS